MPRIKIDCGVCHGAGAECHACGGKGYTLSTASYKTCKTCSGTGECAVAGNGQVVLVLCWDCDGDGKIEIDDDT